MEKLKNNRQKGITLIALVVTITVLIILVTVSINTVLGDNGIIGRAQKAKDSYQNNQKTEDEQMAVLANEMAQYDKTGNEGIIDKTKSYVGYYADVDGDGTVDGVIYADLAVDGSGQWGDDNGDFSYEAITGVKDYIISQTSYSGDFGNNGVLKATGSGKNRLYVMALTDIDENTYTWYTNAYGNEISDYDTLTLEIFGTGKMNMDTMIEQWNSSAYGDQSDNDMWKAVQTQVNKGWFVPSKGEWAAFGSNLKIDGSNYENYKLADVYWSSSLSNENSDWGVSFSTGTMRYGFIYYSSSVRLSTTF